MVYDIGGTLVRDNMEKFTKQFLRDTSLEVSMLKLMVSLTKKYSV